MAKCDENTEKQNMRLSLFLWTTLCGFCMAVMLWYASDKTIVIADMSQEQTGLSVESKTEGKQDATLTLRQSYGVDGSFYVPLPSGIRPENVVMENRYMDRELWIYIQGGQEEFYLKNPIYGDVSRIVEGGSEMQEDGILLKLEMTDVLEYRSTLERDILTVACNKPHELYDFLVVIDPAGDDSEAEGYDYGLSESELALEVARLVQKNFSMSDVRLYLTRTENAEVTDEDRAGLVEAVDADLYIRIGVSVDSESAETYGIQGWYNEEFFIPGFGNVDLADIVTKEVTIAASNRAVGVLPAAKDSILRSIRTAAMELSVGYLSNPQELALLRQEAYREKLADGILEAIQEACDILGQLREEQS